MERKRSEADPAWLGAALFEHHLSSQVLGRDAEATAKRVAGNAEAIAQDVMEDHLAALAPRNRVERLLALQLIWQHARVGRLAMMEATPSNCSLDVARSLNQATDRAMNTFTRQAIAWNTLRATGNHVPRS